jgi:hypothetical protein
MTDPLIQEARLVAAAMTAFLADRLRRLDDIEQSVRALSERYHFCDDKPEKIDG